MRSLQSAIRDAAPWLAVTAIIGGVDCITPPTYAFASIYFIPIFPAAWRSRTAGSIVAAASSFAWIYSDFVQRPVSDDVAQAWNYSTRIVVFILAVFLASTLQREQARIADLDRQRRSLLTLVEHEVPGPLRELANELRGMAGVDAEHAERLTTRAEQLLFLSNDLASLGESRSCVARGAWRHALERPRVHGPRPASHRAPADLNEVAAFGLRLPGRGTRG